MKDFEKEIYELKINTLQGKTMENVKYRCETKLKRNGDEEETFKKQSKVIFIGIHNYYTNCNSYTSKQIEFSWIGPVYLGFALLN